MPSRAPKPGPRPGARPAAPAGAPSTPSPVPASAAGTAKAAEFGRVDEDGTVYVIRGGAERAVGSWQAGSPEEGLKHFAQRFADLSTEVGVLENRLRTRPEDANSVRTQAQLLIGSLDEQAVVGDLDAIETRLKTLLEEADTAGEKAKEAKEARRAEAIQRKEALAAEAEDLAENSTEWKAAGDRIRDILEEWKTIRGIDRKTDDGLWKRYSKARDSFNRRRGAHFAELDRGRAAAKAKKEEIIERAEKLKDSTDWNDTARAYRDLMTEWKAAGRAPRDVDDKLWNRFRAAQDHFFAARNAVNDERDREYEANAQAKDALIAEYDSLIDPEKGLGAAKSKLRELQEKWDAIGYVPRNKMREYEDKIGDIEQRVSDAEEAQWRKSNPVQQDKANQFQVKADDFRAKADAAEAKGNAKQAAELRAQAEQWQEFADVAAKALND
ncbi:DUF349 domain-containing protein [Corynebacterium sp. CCUG 65737]|uniref:DUF349 domain-containing protein n=1 Tax=Corynebacterium sp. CCUG 65737 TaxID=2823889 RepID=UPI00210DCE0C|nr:DUF349 domain-containing protein [Corynebacterium sp. CCUG 65737]MCQ4626773.1 DUF349 domain-containing protein [Corynebacterium sp. CCUG 65737]